jgi:hypothetical protein
MHFHIVKMYKDKEVQNVKNFFERNGGLDQILRRQTSRSHYGSKVPSVTVTVFKYRNKIGKIVVMTCKNIQMHTKIQQHTYRRRIHHILQCQLQDSKYYLPPGMCYLWPSIHRRN